MKPLDTMKHADRTRMLWKWQIWQLFLRTEPRLTSELVVRHFEDEDEDGAPKALRLFKVECTLRSGVGRSEPD